MTRLNCFRSPILVPSESRLRTVEIISLKSCRSRLIPAASISSSMLEDNGLELFSRFFMTAEDFTIWRLDGNIRHGKSFGGLKL